MSTTTNRQQQCDCFRVIEPNNPHQCNLCQRNLSACLYINELSHKISLQAHEISQLKNELQSYQQQLRHQQSDFQHLNSKYVAKIDHVNEMLQQKEQADRELEELSARLFEEANQMVAQEKKQKHQLEQLLRHTREQLSAEQSQLYELRNRMEAVSPPPYKKEDIVRDDSGMLFEATTATASHHPVVMMMASPKKSDVGSTTTTNKYAAATTSLQLDHFRRFIIEQQRRRSSIPSLISDSSFTFNDDIEDDEVRGEGGGGEFGDDVTIIEEEEEEEAYTFFQMYPTTSSSSSEYLRRCEIEDIEPCLQFGHASSKLCIKTLMEHLSQQACFIERINLEKAKLVPPPMTAVTSVYYRPLWERFSSFAATSEQDDERLVCSACDKRPQQGVFYRFRLTEKEDWLLIDQHCRNRLVAVCNFYNFVRNIQLGLYQQPCVEDLYLENIDLRLKMFYARMGV